jgi:hypothetical protein
VSIAYALNDNLLRGDQLRVIDLTTGESVYLTSTATVEVTVQDAAGVPMGVETWPVALTHIAGSRGGFLGVLRNELPWTAGQLWYAKIVADNGVNQHGEFLLPLHVLDRYV